MCKYGTLDNGRLISGAIIKKRRLIGEQNVLSSVVNKFQQFLFILQESVSAH